MNGKKATESATHTVEFFTNSAGEIVGEFHRDKNGRVIKRCYPFDECDTCSDHAWFPKCMRSCGYCDDESGEDHFY